MAAASHAHSGEHDHHGDHGHGHHDHHEPGFLQKWVFSTDHKVIGMQYAVTGLLSLSIGFILMMYMRWSIANPDLQLPMWARWFLNFIGSPNGFFTGAEQWAPNGKISPDLYNMFGAMHGTIMVFMGIVPVAFAAFVNFVTPLQIGAPDMCFPKLNMASYWCQFVGSVVMFYSFTLPQGAAQSGWTNYSPLASTVMMDMHATWFNGQTIWLLAMVFIITASLLGSVNVIATVMNLRARGMTWMRLPFFTWGMFVVAFILLLAFPPLEVAALMQLSDRVFHSSFFLPTGMVVNNQLVDVAGGGSPILYQHLFWFLAHPEVYVLILPAIAICAEVIPINSRKPLWGYKSMVYAGLSLGFFSFIVWAHHMYLTGMGSVISTFFQTTTVLISVPSVILLTCLMISLWGGSIRYNTPMLFASAFLPMFGFGGLTGLPLAFTLLDLHLHDTYYVIGHFHYVVAPGTIFGIFAGVYHWYPKATGRMMSETLGKWHFWPSLIGMNGVFLPMFFQGIHGFHRRWYNGGIAYEQIGKAPLPEWMQAIPGLGGKDYLYLNEVMTFFAFFLAVAQIPFIINFFGSLFFGKKVKSDNPWNATTLEWNTPTPPPHGNFLTEQVVYRGPYEYSVPGADKDYSPQWEKDPGQAEPQIEPIPGLEHHDDHGYGHSPAAAHAH